MRKCLYSTIGKILVIAIMLISAVCIATSAAWAFSGLRVDMRQNIFFPKSYEASSEMVSDYLFTETDDLIMENATINRYFKDGSLDLTETLDISDLNAGIAKPDKNPVLTYSLADLNTFYESAGYVYLSWILQNDYRLVRYSEASGDYGYEEETYDPITDPLTVYGPDATATDRTALSYEEAVYGITDENFNVERPQNGDSRITILCYPELYNVMYNNGLALEKKYLPNAAGSTIAEYAQQNLETFSILDAYKNLVTAAQKVHELTQYTAPDESNAMIWLKNTNSGTVYTNIDAWNEKSLNQVRTGYSAYIDASATDQDDAGKNTEKGCAIIYDGTTKTTDQIAPATKDKSAFYQSEELLMLRDHTLVNATDFLEDGTWQFFIGLDPTYPANDAARSNAAIYEQFAQKQPFGHNALPAAVIAGILFIVMLILSVIQTGHRAEDADRTATEPDCNLPEYANEKYASRRIGIHTTQMERFPIELLVIIDIILWLVLFAITVTMGKIATDPVSAVTNYSGYLPRTFSAAGYERMLPRLYAVLIPAAIAAATLLCWNLKHFVRRLKARTLGASLIKSLVLVVRKVTNSVYRTKEEGQRLVIVYVMIVLVNAMIAGIFGLIAAAAGALFPIIVCIVILAIINIVILRKLMTYFAGRDAVRKGMDEIAAGNLDYKVDVEEISGYNREMAEGVNKVSAGLKAAVENEMKSERMKAELITNVSHDIKTPLTSIINYVDILKRHDIKDDEVRSYIEILDRKSARLKQLVDDLVESSKISSGNITLDLQSIDLCQMVQQMNGEFREKFEERNLSMVCELTDEPMLIKADGARLCRVIENLYSNAAKYSMPGSRVYVKGMVRTETNRTDSKVVLTIRNISEHALNISADELTERFVRGDLSRNTEGSGLGLEIARNLTIMQGGTFDIILDGDLFKVVITFPRV